MRIFWQSYVDETTGADYWRYLRAHLAAAALPGTEVLVHGISPPNATAHPLTELRCSIQMIANAVRAEREGYDAFVVGHFQDAGLFDARAAVDIPVIGLGEATLLHTCQLAARIGIVTINPVFIPWIERQVRVYGLSDRVGGVSAQVFQPAEIMAAFEDAARFDEAKAQFDRECAPMVVAGCDAIVAGGGIPMLLFSRLKGHAVNGAPVVNGLPIALMAAESAVRLSRLNGLGASRAGAFAKAPPRVVDEFISETSGG